MYIEDIAAMTPDQRKARIAELRANNREALATPLASEGGISPYQLSRFSAKQLAKHQSLALTRMNVEFEIRDLSLPEEEIQRRVAEQRNEDRQRSRDRLVNRIDYLSRMGVGKSGKIKPTYQRGIDACLAELKELEA